MPFSHRRVPLLLASSLALLAACNQLHLPQLGFEEEAPPPRIPVSATLVFEENVKNAKFRAQVCGMPWEGHLGHSLATKFLDTSRERFEQVTMAPAGDRPDTAAGEASDLTIRLSLLENSFEGSTATGDDDAYLARVNVRLMAVVDDAGGKPIGKAPLSYHERVKVWTPILLGAQGTCPTGQLDSVMEDAATALAGQMVAAVAAWYGRTHAGAGAAHQAASGPSSHAPAAQPSPIAIRITLLDENENLILEGGENIGIRIDATNTGRAPLPSATVTLSGTSALIDAFATVAAGPLDIGPLQPGETKSTLVWGKLRDEVDPQRGELVVSVVTAGASTSHTLVAALRAAAAGGTGAVAPVPDAPLSAVPMDAASSPRPSSSDRHAILVSLRHYRDPWPDAASNHEDSLAHVVRVLRTSAGLPQSHILVLTDASATTADMETAVLKWLPSQVRQRSIVIVYISTHAVVDPRSGEIFLLPYEGTPSAPHRTLVSLHALQGTLKRINARLCLLLIDAPIAAGGGSKAGKDWKGVIEASPPNRATPVVQVVSNASLRLDGLLVRAMSGEADTDLDNHVSLGELLDYLKVAADIYPNLPTSAPERAIPLTD